MLFRHRPTCILRNKICLAVEFIPILIILSCAIYFAWDLRWVCDDAFISFRYANNLSEGSGLVYNPNEFVEGYTNFSWTLLMSLPLLWGVDVLLFSHIFDSILHIGMYWHVVVSKGTSCLLVFLLCWVSVYHVSVFATSGLETSMFLCLIIWIFRILEIKHHSLFSPPWIYFNFDSTRGGLICFGRCVLYGKKMLVATHFSSFPLCHLEIILLW